MTTATTTTTATVKELVEQKIKATETFQEIQKQYLIAQDLYFKAVADIDARIAEATEAPSTTAKAPAPTPKAEAKVKLEEKAKAAGTTVATVRKVEKARAAAATSKATTTEPTSIDNMKADQLKVLAKELGVSYEGVKFTSSTQRNNFRALLKAKVEAQATTTAPAPAWEGLSPSRQAQLSKMMGK